jgi:hypothetical protein
MKKTIAYPAVLVCTLVLLLSCSKSSKDNFSRSTSIGSNKVVNAKIAPGGTYTLTVGTSGDVSINKQAAHYLVSETGTGENGSLIYKYVPASGFKGLDEILLLHTIETLDYSSAGCNYGGSPSMSRVTSSIVVKLTIED